MQVFVRKMTVFYGGDCLRVETECKTANYSLDDCFCVCIRSVTSVAAICAVQDNWLDFAGKRHCSLL